MTNSPVSIFIHDNSTEFRLEVRGTLDARASAELMQIYETAGSSLNQVPKVLDLRRVNQIDDNGHDLIDLLKRQGVVCKLAEPTPEPTCFLTLLRSTWRFLTSAPVPALLTGPCRGRSRK